MASLIKPWMAVLKAKAFNATCNWWFKWKKLILSPSSRPELWNLARLCTLGGHTPREASVSCFPHLLVASGTPEFVFGSLIYASLSLASFVPAKLVTCEWHYQIPLPPQGVAWLLWTTVASASMSWLWGNTSLRSWFLEPGVPFHILSLGSFLSNKFPFSQNRALAEWGFTLWAPFLAS